MYCIRILRPKSRLAHTNEVRKREWAETKNNYYWTKQNCVDCHCWLWYLCYCFCCCAINTMTKRPVVIKMCFPLLWHAFILINIKRIEWSRETFIRCLLFAHSSQWLCFGGRVHTIVSIVHGTYNYDALHHLYLCTRSMNPCACAPMPAALIEQQFKEKPHFTLD